MRAREFMEAIPSLGKTAQGLGQAIKTAKTPNAPKNPMDDNPLQKKNPFAKKQQGQQSQLDKAKDAASQELKRKLVKPGSKIPLPTDEPNNKVTDFEVDNVKGDEVVLKNPKPKPGEPLKTTHKMKDLDPVIKNLIGK